MASSHDALKKLTVQELEKYLSHHQLSLKRLQNDKITRIMAHISLSKGSNKQPQYKSISQNDLQEAETENGDESDEESEDDVSEDEIVAIIDSESEDEDPHEESEDESDEMHAPMIYEGPVTSRS